MLTEDKEEQNYAESLEEDILDLTKNAGEKAGPALLEQKSDESRKMGNEKVFVETKQANAAPSDKPREQALPKEEANSAEKPKPIYETSSNKPPERLLCICLSNPEK